MDQVLERISAWEAAGLIDPATAARLRLAEAELPAEAPPSTATAAAVAPAVAPPGPSSVASISGPGVSIGEMFAYLGGTFVLAAYELFLFRSASNSPTPETSIAFGAGAAAIALAALGLVLTRGDARRRRAAGLMFVLTVVHVGIAGTSLAAGAGIQWPVGGVIGGGLALLAAILLRLQHPAVLTQVALLGSITAFAVAVLGWLETVFFPAAPFDDGLLPAPDPSGALIRVVLSAAWWLGLAVLIGIIGLREADSADDDPDAGRRASLSRLWAGLLAVIGLASSVTRSDYSAGGGGLRVIEPWIADLAILFLAAILVERAFRRDASTFVYAAALALMIAATDFNYSYLSTSTELGLLIEGVILLGAGVAADRLRRRIGQPAADLDIEPEVTVPATPA